MSILREYDELTALEKLSLINMSYSRLDTYQSCAAKYFYSYVLKEPRIFGPAAAMGTAVHTVLEDTDLNRMTHPDMMTRLDEQLEREGIQEVNGEDHAVLVEAAKGCVTDFYDTHVGDKFDTIAKEYSFNVVIGNCNFIGYVDRVDRTPDGGVLITDYKTGKYQVSKNKVAENLQLGLYAVVARKRFPELSPIRGELYYLRSGQRIGHTYTDAELDEMEYKIKEVAGEIVAADNFKYTQNTFTCSKMCDFGKSGVCPRGAAVIRKYDR